jgi:hypothetical protein
MVWKSLTDWVRNDEDKFATQVERCIKPQVQRLLERSFAEWKQAVVQNEMQAVAIDVDRHLQEEAAEYQRVMQEIEDSLGIHSSSLHVKELVERWLRPRDGSHSGANFELPGGQVFGDMSWLIGSIVMDIMADVILHLSVVWIPVVGLVITAVRLLWREASLREQLPVKVAQAIQEGLTTVSQTEAAAIRKRVKESFDGLKEKIAGNIDEEIALIDASLQAIIDRKQAREFSADQDRQRLDVARAAIVTATERLHTALLKV